MKRSLIEVAKAHDAKGRKKVARFAHDEDKMQLVLAYLRGEVSNYACAEALGIRNSNMTGNVGSILAAAVRAGRLVESKK